MDNKSKICHDRTVNLNFQFCYPYDQNHNMDNLVVPHTGRTLNLLGLLILRKQLL
jgi:hypothetical protein